LGRVDVSFSSFLCAKEKDRQVAGRVVKQKTSLRLRRVRVDLKKNY